jgi:translation initiation factor IF-2
VSGPLLIALTPLPAVGHLAQAWVLALVGICLIPVGWCIIFASAGAISLDVSDLGGGAHLGSRTAGAFAALVTFYIAFKWPLMVLGHVRNGLGGLGLRPAAAFGGSGVVSDGALAAKARRARSGLQAAMLAGGRGVGLAAGALGAPHGGLAGLAGRAARPHLATAAASGAIAMSPPVARPRPTLAPGRVARAGDAVRDIPARMRDAWRSAGRSSSASAQTGTRGRAAAGGGIGHLRRRNGSGGGNAHAPKPAPAGSPTSSAHAKPATARGTVGGASARPQASAPAQPREEPPPGAAHPASGRAPSDRGQRPAPFDSRSPRPAPPGRPARPAGAERHRARKGRKG